VSALAGSAQGEPLNWHWFRAKVWTPAFTAAGLEYRVPYALRHTALSEWLSRGIPVLDVAKFGGTSMLMIQRTYGHLAADSHDRFREALEAAR
jgi:integrase